MCDECVGRKFSGYGTPEIFRDYGFIELFPQRWPVGLLQFDVHENLGDTSADTVADYNLEWSGQFHPENFPKRKNELFMKQFQTEIERLNQLRRDAFENLTIRETIPHHEWKLVWEYIDAVERAFTLALNRLSEYVVPESDEL